MRINRYIAPEQQRHSAARASLFEDSDGACHPLIVAREEQHGHAVIALCGKDVTALLSFLAKEPMRHLEQDAGTITRVLL